MLRLELHDSAAYESLLLRDPLVPRTWSVVRRGADGGASAALAETPEASAFFQDALTVFGSKAAVFISVRQDETGQHSFVSLGEAAQALQAQAARSLQEVSEGQVKRLSVSDEVVLLYARPDAAAAASREAPPDEVPADAELCPRRSPWASNYSIIPDLSLGRTQRLILCNETTLCRELPDERIFEYLSLIVNCHEANATVAKYRVGACSSERKPEVISHAVHTWFRDKEDMNRWNDEIQEAIWRNLQRGVVAVHCLAGIHRAACIVACHYLWRHHALGHRDLPCRASDIYPRLQAVRPAVEPAYTHVLESYAAHLRRRFPK